MATLSNQAVEYFPNEGFSYFYNVLSLIHKSNLKGGIENVEEGILVSGGNKSKLSRLKGAKSLILIAQKKLDEAKKELDEAVVLAQSNDAFLKEVEGYFYESKGENIKAKEAWLAAKSLGNKSLKMIQKIQP
jgi:tetratricopeptide (TPR) repeat protein